MARTTPTAKPAFRRPSLQILTKEQLQGSRAKRKEHESKHRGVRR